MATSDLPTSDWQHSHALEAGDELVDTNTGTPITVDNVTDDGGVEVKVWLDDRDGQEYTTDFWSENEARVGLTHGEIETTDGKSHELASH